MSRDELLFIKGLYKSAASLQNKDPQKTDKKSLENWNNFTAKTECFSHSSHDP